ncbi:MAG: hypothetical protein MI919_09115, partial [Holophagales bacterium]|nr:hypothetical protein [Holophagales bacterium]
MQKSGWVAQATWLDTERFSACRALGQEHGTPARAPLHKLSGWGRVLPGPVPGTGLTLPAQRQLTGFPPGFASEIWAISAALSAAGVEVTAHNLRLLALYLDVASRAAAGTGKRGPSLGQLNLGERQHQLQPRLMEVASRGYPFEATGLHLLTELDLGWGGDSDPFEDPIAFLRKTLADTPGDRSGDRLLGDLLRADWQAPSVPGSGSVGTRDRRSMEPVPDQHSESPWGEEADAGDLPTEMRMGDHDTFQVPVKEGFGLPDLDADLERSPVPEHPAVPRPAPVPPRDGPPPEPPAETSELPDGTRDGGAAPERRFLFRLEGEHARGRSVVRGRDFGLRFAHDV